MYQQHPLVAQKILNWVMRLYQWRPPVAEKILNWLQDCTGTINQLLKRSWIGLQDCVPAASSSLKRYSIGLQDCTRRHCWYDGCSQVQWNHYYYYYYIWQEYPLPFSQQLLSPCSIRPSHEWFPLSTLVNRRHDFFQGPPQKWRHKTCIHGNKQDPHNAVGVERPSQD